MFPILQIGPLAIKTPGLLLLVGIYLGLLLAERRLDPHRVTANHLYNLTFIALGAGLLSARLSYFFQHFASFKSYPWSILSLDASLLDPFAGMAVALVALLVYGGRKRIPFWSALDAFTPALALFLVFLGLAHFASGTAFGAPTSLPWGIQLWGETRHPSQVYETLAALIILFVLWRRFGRSAPPGDVFLLFASLSAGAALFLGTWRGDNSLVFNSFRQDQVFAWLVLAAGLWILERRRGKPAGHEGQ